MYCSKKIALFYILPKWNFPLISGFTCIPFQICLIVPPFTSGWMDGKSFMTNTRIERSKHQGLAWCRISHPSIPDCMEGIGLPLSHLARWKVCHHLSYLAARKDSTPSWMEKTKVRIEENVSLSNIYMGKKYRLGNLMMYFFRLFMAKISLAPLADGTSFCSILDGPTCLPPIRRNPCILNPILSPYRQHRCFYSFPYLWPSCSPTLRTFLLLTCGHPAHPYCRLHPCLFCSLSGAIQFSHPADYTPVNLLHPCQFYCLAGPSCSPKLLTNYTPVYSIHKLCHPVLQPCELHPCLFYSLVGSSCSPTLRTTLLSIYYTPINYIF
jgi:hypothetical protein